MWRDPRSPWRSERASLLRQGAVQRAGSSDSGVTAGSVAASACVALGTGLLLGPSGYRVGNASLSCE
jgi:hypothetical protein